MRRDGSWRRFARVFRRDARDEIDEELSFHLEHRVDDYVARGLDPESARRAARERLGDMERAREECVTLLSAERRTHERRMALTISWLDVKLGLRMLLKFPGLSVVAVLGMAVAIAIGAGYFAGYGAILTPALPLDAGDRVVGLRYRDVSRPGPDAAVSVHDYLAWRGALSTVQELSAFRTQQRTAITADGGIELIEVAAITASGFRVARVSPVLGRPLLEEDERVGAAPVLVISNEEWQRVFDGDPAVLGRTVRLGGTEHTIVGVMPPGFRFPVNHEYWAALPLNASTAQATDDASVLVFGRLAEDVTIERAQSELATVGQRMAVAFPSTHEHLRPVILPYTHLQLGLGPEVEIAVRAIQLAMSLLLVIVALNVAVLVYARNVTRTGEIAVRSALGASRRRIVTQLFVEALVLSVAASVIGLTLAGVALGLVDEWIRRSGEMSFWIEFGLSASVIAYVAVLAIVASAIVGVAPALKATGKRLQSGLQQFSSRGSAMQLGRTWSALIVLQVGVAVAALPAAVDFAEQSIRIGTRAPAPTAHNLLRATVVMEREATTIDARDSVAAEAAFRARFAERATELIRRVAAQPEIAAVTIADRFPGLEQYARIEVERSEAQAADTTAWVGRMGTATNRVGRDLFDVFDVPILAGRGFVPADASERAATVIVNASFAQRIAGGASVLGRRIRYAASGDQPPGPWLEIVGVVPDFAANFTSPNSLDPPRPRLFHAAGPGDLYPMTLVVRTGGGEPAPFAARLRDIAATLDPTFTLENVETVSAAFERGQQAIGSLGLMIIAVMLSVLLLSAAGMYALMSFTVAKRRREIGIRSALGADPRRILTGIFTRAAAQLGGGILAGLLLAAAFAWVTGDMDRRSMLLLPAVSALMLTVGVVAAVGPARRGLAVQPTEALRED